jgi:hypothetical protein
MPPPNNPGAGRPRKLDLDDQLRGRIMAMVRMGAYPERAAVACGVSARSHYAWQEKGLEERAHRDAGKKPRVTFEPYLEYVDDLDQAVAEAEMMMLGKISQGGETWKANFALLERRFRDRWGAKGPPAPATPAAPSATPTTTPLDQVGQRRNQRRVKKA